jgi:hypothetical protein
VSIEEIIAALEKAHGPSRDLDLEIWRAASGKPWRWEPRVDNAITWDKYGKGAIGNPVVSLDPFTSSLDAALTLVPEGAVWCMTHTGLPKTTVFASVHGGPTAVGRTPAIALCIAALRARSITQ